MKTEIQFEIQFNYKTKKKHKIRTEHWLINNL